MTKKNYFEGEYFHRVVKDFIIQGGNSDNRKTSQKRRSIGRYLLPPDTKKGYKHHRGIVSMPSSEIENPHKLASPYEFFIVQKKRWSISSRWELYSIWKSNKRNECCGYHC